MGYEMKTANWWDLFDKHLPKIKWFIEAYFDDAMAILEKHREGRTRRDQNSALDLLHDIWFRLPDSKFNIMENPSGWTEFLDLIED